MLMLGKMSVGVREIASGPTKRIASAITTKVYGRVSAIRTIHMERNHHYTGLLFMKWTAAGGLLALALSVAGCARDRGVQAAEGQKARGVKVEAAQVRDVRRQVDLVGTLAAKEEV